MSVHFEDKSEKQELLKDIIRKLHRGEDPIWVLI